MTNFKNDDKQCGQNKLWGSIIIQKTLLKNSYRLLLVENCVDRNFCEHLRANFVEINKGRTILAKFSDFHANFDHFLHFLINIYKTIANEPKIREIVKVSTLESSYQ